MLGLPVSVQEPDLEQMQAVLVRTLAMRSKAVRVPEKAECRSLQL